MANAHLEVNQTKIKGGCQSGRKVVPHDFRSDLPLAKMSTGCKYHGGKKI